MWNAPDKQMTLECIVLLDCFCDFWKARTKFHHLIKAVGLDSSGAKTWQLCTYSIHIYRLCSPQFQSLNVSQSCKILCKSVLMFVSTTLLMEDDFRLVIHSSSLDLGPEIQILSKGFLLSTRSDYGQRLNVLLSRTCFFFSPLTLFWPFCSDTKSLTCS